MVAGDSTLFAVNPALGVKTLHEFIKLAKSGTVTINCGSPGSARSGISASSSSGARLMS
jgi:tripartite-type tricarboxylate transporter receptor subunit TctC